MIPFAARTVFRNVNSPRNSRSKRISTLLPRHNQPFYPFSRPASTMAHIPPAVIKVQGPHEASEPDHETRLKDQLQSVSPTVTNLLIDDSTPSDAEWALLGAHLKNVEELELESGFNEELNDKNLPLHWPLRKLTLSSACGELIQSPFVRQGLVSHLSLYFTCNLRFEGPTTNELTRLHDESTAKETKDDLDTHKGIKITYLPELVVEHMQKVYADPDRKLDPENEPPAGPINLKTLEIWENDAIDTLCRMSGALPHIVDNLHTLRLRSTSGLDFSMITEDTFRQFLPAMENLQVLNLTVGEIFQDAQFLPTLHTILPPNLTTLYFRGPVSLVTSEHWVDWLRAFRSTTFLPKLQRLAFVLDLHYGEHHPRSWGKKESPAPIGLLQQARQECESLYGIARERGIVLEDMPTEPHSKLLRCVDLRW
ncbi:hypothetical protein N7493_006030 [Penicillium malachiteum]|uniref:Uncharacterized protein n=1 Tax=Penicillium malachiteum TaxID=1324776 RepID=A0AAD6MVZ6_9EURO|nr:hypothetical protein N7493_006030 [Penicillium malachiteum]